MFKFKYFSKSNNNLIQFLVQSFSYCVFYKCKSWEFFEIHFKTPCIFRENFEFGFELLVAANLNN